MHRSKTNIITLVVLGKLLSIDVQSNFDVKFEYLIVAVLSIGLVHQLSLPVSVKSSSVIEKSTLCERNSCNISC